MIIGVKVNTMIKTKIIGERQDEQPSLKITLGYIYIKSQTDT